MKQNLMALSRALCLAHLSIVIGACAVGEESKSRISTVEEALEAATKIYVGNCFLDDNENRQDYDVRLCRFEIALSILPGDDDPEFVDLTVAVAKHMPARYLRMLPHNYVSDINSKGDEAVCAGEQSEVSVAPCPREIPIVYPDQSYVLIQDHKNRTIFFHPVFNPRDDELYRLLLEKMSDRVD